LRRPGSHQFAAVHDPSTQYNYRPNITTHLIYYYLGSVERGAELALPIQAMRKSLIYILLRPITPCFFIFSYAAFFPLSQTVRFHEWVGPTGRLARTYGSVTRSGPVCKATCCRSQSRAPVQGFNAQCIRGILPPPTRKSEGMRGFELEITPLRPNPLFRGVEREKWRQVSGSPRHVRVDNSRIHTNITVSGNNMQTLAAGRRPRFVLTCQRVKSI